jgi:hypothetical protein
MDSVNRKCSCFVLKFLASRLLAAALKKLIVTFKWLNLCKSFTEYFNFPRDQVACFLNAVRSHKQPLVVCLVSSLKISKSRSIGCRYQSCLGRSEFKCIEILNLLIRTSLDADETKEKSRSSGLQFKVLDFFTRYRIDSFRFDRFIW